MLTLPIKKKWFDMILSGEKKEEYRDQTLYWLNRLYSEIGRQHEGDKRTMTTREPFWVCFRNGYSPDSPTFKAKVTFSTGYGVEQWGAEKNKRYIVLRILEIRNVKAD